MIRGCINSQNSEAEGTNSMRSGQWSWPAAQCNFREGGPGPSSLSSLPTPHPPTPLPPSIVQGLTPPPLVQATQAGGLQVTSEVDSGEEDSCQASSSRGYGLAPFRR